MAYPTGAVQVTGFIGTTSILDTYATHLDFLGFGGLRAVADTTARDLITTQRRTFGMIAVCQDGSGSYILSNVAMGGTDNVVSNNANWLPYSTGGSVTYTNANPTTIAVGGYPLGSTFPTAQTMQQMWDGLMYPYVPPTFTSFSISAFSTSYEVGATISGNQTFAWSFSNPANVTASTMNILDVTGGTTLASSISIVSPSVPITIATYTPIVPASYQWRGQATNTQSTVFNSALFTATWRWREYYGTSPLATLTATDILALANTPLASGLAGTYNFAVLDYKYFVWSDSFGSPTATTGMKDASTGLSLAMADSGDDVFYSNVQNGWYYGLVSVTNTFGIVQNYRVYRTKNTLGSTLQALIS
jgi:hypothetical protein